ncbi:MAG: transglycosylase SLT domain-containing protein [Myxococcales bacterium]|nr:transglycosylase SLT domain-containing protein [Myxococcales bacterium]
MSYLIAAMFTPAIAQEPQPQHLIEIGAPLRALVLDLPSEALEAARTGDPEESLTALRAMDTATLSERQRADWSFLVAWATSQTEQPEQAMDVVETAAASTAPASYVATARGVVLAAGGEPTRALEILAGVGSDELPFARAAIAISDAHRALDQPDRAWAIAEQVVSRPDPSPGNAPALLALAEHHGLESDAARPLLTRLWTYYPDTEEGEAATERLESMAFTPEWQQLAARAEHLMWAERYDRALDETKPHREHASEASVDGCRLRYVRGRSFYKRNKLTAAVGELEGIGAQCAEVEGTYGPRGLYLMGTAEYRRKRFASSAKVYESLAETYTSHSMADDAWTRGGISLLEDDRASEAASWWERALSDHPDGDTVPEAALRLAFWRYDQGEPTKAVEIAERLAALPPEGNAHHVEAGRYWAARWRMYPDAKVPSLAVEEEEARKAAIAGWRSLCEDLPHSFYALLAFARLTEVAPDVAEALAQRSTRPKEDTWAPWQVRAEMLRDPHYRDGIALMRLGLPREGLAEWRRSHFDELAPDEKVWTTELRIAAGDWLFAHDDLRRWIISNPLTTLGDREWQIIEVAYPDRYWAEVQRAVLSDYRYPPRLLHGLVREESNFNREIVSFAGAIGLSQLMWATAQQTAGWMDLKIRRADLTEPQTNLRIGARYLDSLFRQLSESPFLSLAAYNGGARNVKKWVKAHDNPPVDEWVERIPYRETRGYVKRVMGTWQTMRYHHDDGPAFPDLSAFNHEALP